MLASTWITARRFHEYQPHRKYPAAPLTASRPRLSPPGLPADQIHRTRTARSSVIAIVVTALRPALLAPSSQGDKKRRAIHARHVPAVCAHARAYCTVDNDLSVALDLVVEGGTSCRYDMSPLSIPARHTAGEPQRYSHLR